MMTLRAKIYAGLAIALLVAGFGVGVWLMYGWVQDARAVADAAKTEADRLTTVVADYRVLIDDMAKKQRATDATLATAAEQGNRLRGELASLKTDLDEIARHDPETKAWADQPVPRAYLERLRNKNTTR